MTDRVDKITERALWINSGRHEVLAAAEAVRRDPALNHYVAEYRGELVAAERNRGAQRVFLNAKYSWEQATALRAKILKELQEAPRPVRDWQRLNVLMADVAAQIAAGSRRGIGGDGRLGVIESIESRARSTNDTDMLYALRIASSGVIEDVRGKVREGTEWTSAGTIAERFKSDEAAEHANVDALQTEAAQLNFVMRSLRTEILNTEQELTNNDVGYTALASSWQRTIFGEDGSYYEGGGVVMPSDTRGEGVGHSSGGVFVAPHVDAVGGTVTDPIAASDD